MLLELWQGDVPVLGIEIISAVFFYFSDLLMNWRVFANFAH